MTDRPIIFSGPMVKALLEGRKSQTRRLIPERTLDRYYAYDEWCSNVSAGVPTSRQFEVEFFAERAPYAIGDRLYVREAHYLHNAHGQSVAPGGVDHGKRWGPWSGLPFSVSPDLTQVAYFKEGFDRSAPKWRPSIHMPRWASRLTLTVTDVRVQRLTDISDKDALAEGVEGVIAPRAGQDIDIDGFYWPGGPARMFRELWNSIHGDQAWSENPWVVAVSFDVRKGNIDG